MKSYLEALPNCSLVVAIGKVWNNFAFICKKYYISKLFEEVGFSNSKSKTYSTHSIMEKIQANMNYFKNFELSITELDILLPVLSWLPKIPKALIGARFIVGSKNCRTKPLFNTISKNFKIIFDTVETRKNFFYSGCKKSWFVKKFFPVVTKVNKLMYKKN